MKLLAIIAIFMLGATGAVAQTLRVQSGDHVGFTRLVLPIGTDREWSIEQQENNDWLLSLSPSVDGFDTSGAFELIQRNRLEGLVASESLTLELACDCAISSFRHQGQYLVIDIADPDPEAPLADEPETVETTDARQRSADALPNLAALLGAPAQLPLLSEVTPELPAIDEPELAPEAAPNPRLEEAAEIMAEQLARAAASGLLDSSLGESYAFGDPIPERPEELPHNANQLDTPEPPTPELVTAPTPPEPTDSPADLPIRTQTAIDPRLVIDLPLTPAGPEEACQNTPFDARDWADTTSFEQDLGALRLALYDDRDELSEEAAQDLALYYLYHGFGAEARHWLNQLREPPEDVLHVASLVDGAQTARFLEVESPADCSQGELLWRYYGGAIMVDLTNDDLAAIQRAYAELPTHLRDLIGPRLARTLHDDRHGPAARNIRDILARGGRVSDAVLQLLDLDLGLSPAGSSGETRNALTDMLMTNESDPVATMAQALAFDRQAGVRPTLTRLTAAEALLRETGDGPETDRLWQEILLGHASLGSLDTALAMIGNPERDGTARETALTALISERVAVRDTAGLLVLAHSYGREWRPQGSDAGRAQVSAIALLREAGLYEAAQILRDVRRPLILPAPQDAEGEEPDQLLQAWENGNWPELAELHNGPHGDIATRMLERGGEESASPPQDLAALDAVVTDSRNLRQTVTELLARPTPQ